MAIDLLKNKGVPLDKQRFTWERAGAEAHQQAQRRCVYAGADYFDEWDRMRSEPIQSCLCPYEQGITTAARPAAGINTISRISPKRLMDNIPIHYYTVMSAASR